MRRLLLLSLLALSGCASPATVDNATKFAIRYHRDTNTDLCFAYIGSSTHGGWQVVSFTHVPMTACERRP